MKKYRYLVAFAFGGALAGCSGAAMQPAVPPLQNGIAPLAHNSLSAVQGLPPMLRAALSASASWPETYFNAAHTGFNPLETT
ncbi:MAG: hypothetical protein JO078_09650, partial [Candidatus Eremiobacteraeota bacterium]|nr:hypothetical protein [Candidatus Eremiobacteraeota bacterium]